MLAINIPGWKSLHLSYLLLDYNGTLAVSGILIPETKPLLLSVAEKLQIHIVTGDTFGKAQAELTDIPCQLKILSAKNQSGAKEEYIHQLGANETIAIGNGRNDKLMLERAALGVAVIGKEGCTVEAMQAADVIVSNINHALELLLQPLSLMATLRS